MPKNFVSIARITVAILSLNLCGFGMLAQSPNTARPEFDVASVRQNISGNEDSKIEDAAPARFTVSNTPLIFLIFYAYDLKAYQLIGAPEWTREKVYDVVGTYPGEKRPSEPEIRAMVKNLLVERFGLKGHSEQRDIPAYDLVLARKDGRLGSQLVKSNVDCDVLGKARDRSSRTNASGPSSVSATRETPECSMTATRRYIAGGAQTMAQLVTPLGVMVSRPIVDKTGLKGAYDIDLQWDSTGLAVEPAGSGKPSEAPSIFAALQEQLGLKLVPHKEEFDVFVIDQIRPPDSN